MYPSGKESSSSPSSPNGSRLLFLEATIEAIATAFSATGVGVLKVVGTELFVILIVVEWWLLSFDEFFKSLLLEVFFGSRGKEENN